jgi:hypothetical protein
MSTTTIISIIGWSFLVMSWIIPIFIEHKYKREYVRIALASLAMGAFLANVVIMCMR